MNFQIQVENIKCGGCSNTISSRLQEMDGIESVAVDIAQGLIAVESTSADEAALRESVTSRLAKLGYPETGSIEGIKATAAKAKSFVSCAVGRMEN